MKEVKFYEALDGTQFDTESDCIEYEANKLMKNNFFFNARGDSIGAIDYASYAFFATREMALLYRDTYIERDSFGSDAYNLADTINMYEDEEIQLYYYDYSDCEWHHYSELKSRFNILRRQWNLVENIIIMNSKGE